MSDQVINFFFEDIEEKEVAQNVYKWLIDSLLRLKKPRFEINYILCSDEYLLQVNRDYLNHDYYTDIITFNNSEPQGDLLEADIFISVDRVADNAREMGVTHQEEFSRVLIHGILHLAGYNDKTDEEQAIMTSMEDKYLALQS